MEIISFITAVTLFRGITIIFNMNKNFKSHTIVKSSLFAPKLDYLKRTKLEDEEFNRKFHVYTNDEVDARYLLTPAFMERLKNIEVAFRAKDITAAFYEDRLVIALSTNKDLFSIGSLAKPVTDSKPYFQMFEEILSIIQLIDHFKLNQKIGL